MMLLAVDVGNTHTVLGCYDGTELGRTWRISSRGVGTPDELRAQIELLLGEENLYVRTAKPRLGGHRSASAQPGGFRAIEAIVVSSVVPRITSILREVFEGSNLKVIDHKWPFSFKIDASPAEQIGADRLVNAEAALRDHGSPLIIIDSGTATTICAISSGEPPSYLGGAIMPGMELSLESLAKNAARLFSVELIAPDKAIGSNTQQALQSGILLGYAGMIDSMIRRFSKELGADHVRVVATGGVSQRLQGLLEEVDVYDPELTLRGIRYLYESVRDL